MSKDADKNAMPQPEADALPDDWFGPIDALVREYEDPPREATLASTPRLADLHGMGAAKEWAETLIRDLRDFREGRIALSECDRGCVLAGPPGTGKTTLVRALAQDAGLPFIATSAATWLAHSYLGPVIQAVKADFAAARQNAPSIIFIDEIDGLTDRTAVDPRYRSYWSGFVGSVLEEIDGIRSQPGVIVIGATNHLDAVDRALLRSGRLERVIEIAVPEPEDLAGILRQKLGSDLPGEDLMPAALLGLGGTGADAERWVRGARRRARYKGCELTIQDLIAEICGGTNELEPDFLFRCAVHEAGHGVAAVVRGEATQVDISLVKRAAIAGSTRALTRGEALTPDAARRMLIYLLAGRAAEEVMLGEVSGGAGGMEESDLAGATRLAVRMVTSYGLVGPDPLIYWGANLRPPQLPPHMFTEVRRELNAAYAEAVTLIQQHLQAVSQLATHLMMHLAAPDPVIRTIIRESLEPSGSIKATDTWH
jgi:ATP-dependent Zn protease